MSSKAKAFEYGLVIVLKYLNTLCARLHYSEIKLGFKKNTWIPKICKETFFFPHKLDMVQGCSLGTSSLIFFNMLGKCRPRNRVSVFFSKGVSV